MAKKFNVESNIEYQIIYMKWTEKIKEHRQWGGIFEGAILKFTS